MNVKKGDKVWVCKSGMPTQVEVGFECIDWFLPAGCVHSDERVMYDSSYPTEFDCIWGMRAVCLARLERATLGMLSSFTKENRDLHRKAYDAQHEELLRIGDLLQACVYRGEK